MAYGDRISKKHKTIITALSILTNDTELNTVQRLSDLAEKKSVTPEAACEHLAMAPRVQFTLRRLQEFRAIMKKRNCSYAEAEAWFNARLMAELTGDAGEEMPGNGPA